MGGECERVRSEFVEREPGCFWSINVSVCLCVIVLMFVLPLALL